MKKINLKDAGSALKREEMKGIVGGITAMPYGYCMVTCGSNGAGYSCINYWGGSNGWICSHP